MTMWHTQMLRGFAVASGSLLIAGSSLANTPEVLHDLISRSATGWQEVSVNLSAVAGDVQIGRVNLPFTLIANSLTGSLTFDVDAVRWEK